MKKKIAITIDDELLSKIISDNRSQWIEDAIKLKLKYEMIGKLQDLQLDDTLIDFIYIFNNLKNRIKEIKKV